jgi:hypothetical protein
MLVHVFDETQFYSVLCNVGGNCTDCGCRLSYKKTGISFYGQCRPFGRPYLYTRSARRYDICFADSVSNNVLDDGNLTDSRQTTYN